MAAGRRKSGGSERWHATRVLPASCAAARGRSCSSRGRAVCRVGVAVSRRQARQLVRRRHVQVNSRTVNVPSFRVRPGDEVKLADASRELVQVKLALEQFGRQQPVSWIQVDTDKALGKMTQ